MTRKISRRELLARPYAGEHGESLRRRMAPPRGLGGLLVWYLEGFRAEMPEAIHVAGVWRSRMAPLDRNGTPVEQIPGEHLGGSLLGSPRLADPFRSFVEGSPFATEASELEGHQSREGDEHYRTPMRAAIARLNGRHFCSPLERRSRDHSCPEGSIFARLVFRIAARDGDWESAGLEFVQPALVRFVVQEALFRLWRAYDDVPPARPFAEEVAVA